MVDDRWNYEYRKVIGLPTYPLPIKYPNIIRIVIFITTTLKKSESYLWIFEFLLFYSSKFEQLFECQVVMYKTMNCSNEKSTKIQ